MKKIIKFINKERLLIRIMGVPTLFRELLQNKINYVTRIEKNPEYFFLDFNSFIYRIHYKFPFSSEKQLIHNVIVELHRLIEEIHPTKMVYIAIDGTAPRAKMVQQRSRRYKSLQLDRMKQEYFDHYDLPVSKTWNPSNHICPGTEFMMNLNQAILKMLEKNFEWIPSKIFDSCLRPGEGEHKILPHVKRLRLENPNATVVIFSPDNDIISLALLTQKSHIKILRYCDGENDGYIKRMAKLPMDTTMFVFDIDLLRQSLVDEFPEEDETNIVLDFNFLLAMVGNDFVTSLPFLKIKNGGLQILKKLYAQIKTKHQPQKRYLIDKQTFTVNGPFFKDIIKGLSLMEDTEMKKLQLFLTKQRTAQHIPAESFDNFYNNLQHAYICNTNHPLYDEYAGDFDKINYNAEKHQWKAQYYEHFLQIDSKNFSVYNGKRTKVVQEYLKSLMFTLRYYNQGCPSWTWHYHYPMPPVFQDVFTVLEKQHFDLNRITFEKGIPFSPYQQLSLILPPQKFDLLPSSFQHLLKKFAAFYPMDFRIDAVLGLKYIYSEARLPEFTNFSSFLFEVKTLERKLSKKDAKRNIIMTKVFRL
ncbi:MAG: hypothetical protein CMM15_13490 [Rhodospirillaceae bacterium]|nr:hypothetical protein [Rhodospirillaceae bacterium]